jgi:chromate reductase
MTTLKFLGITGSLRRKSTNKGLLRVAAAHLSEGVSMEIADLSDIPFYNADITEKPASVLRLLAQMADALVLACTEYNYSIAPALKNILDWTSREPGNALLSGKPIALMGSGGGMGPAASLAFTAAAELLASSRYAISDRHQMHTQGVSKFLARRKPLLM